MMIHRVAEAATRELLATNAAVAVLGPRQIGKTTLARGIADADRESVYLDLERPADRRRLSDPDLYLRSLSGRLVVLDEVHRVPGLFEVLRGVIDDNRRRGIRGGQFLLLGSASLDLIRFTSESLAGRLAHLDLSGVNVDEAATVGIDEDALWLRGGYPESLVAGTDAVSAGWRADLVRTYMEREVPIFAPRIPAETLRRLWTMVAHNSGGLLNASRLAESVGVSGPTVDRYLDLLTDLGLIRRMQPWHVNVAKRVVKAPKVYVRDTGMLHALLEIQTLHELLGHPAVGPSYESFVVECVIDAVGGGMQPHHYRTARGDEVDLVLVRGGVPVIAVEVKRSSAPQVGAGFHRACDDLGVDDRIVVHPAADPAPYPLGNGVTAMGLPSLVERLRRVG